MDEDYIIYNVCAERLRDPPVAPSGVTLWHGSPLSNLEKMLPFGAEDLCQIAPGSDVTEFCEAFYYTKETDHPRSFLEFAQRTPLLPFVSTDASANEHSSEALVVRALKYPYAIHYTLLGLVGEDMVFSVQLPYLCEIKSDVRCSLNAVENGYYKQSLQMLRNALEVTVAHAYFGRQGRDYYDLIRSANFHMPRFSGKSNGMIDKLVNEEIYEEELGAQLVEIYRDLSGAVHSEIKRLNVVTKHPDISRIKEWAVYMQRVGDLILGSILRMLRKGM